MPTVLTSDDDLALLAPGMGGLLISVAGELEVLKCKLLAEHRRIIKSGFPDELRSQESKTFIPLTSPRHSQPLSARQRALSSPRERAPNSPRQGSSCSRERGFSHASHEVDTPDQSMNGEAIKMAEKLNFDLKLGSRLAAVRTSPLPEPMADAAVLPPMGAEMIAVDAIDKVEGFFPGRRNGRRSTIGAWIGLDSESPQGFWESLVTSLQFESFFAVFIMANCVSMGVVCHLDFVASSGQETPLSQQTYAVCVALEHIFTFVFCVECVLRFKVFGWRGFDPTKEKSRLNFFDAMLVLVTGVLLTWVVPLYSLIFHKDGSGNSIEAFQVFRAVRVARLVRVFHRVPLFREAWLLISGLTDSARTLFWTCVVIFFVTYIFAIFGLVAIVEPLLRIKRESPGDGAVVSRIDELLMIIGGIDRLMFTLIQVLCMDSFNSLIREIMAFVQLSWIYFYAYIAIAALVLMNLVTAVIVEHAMSQSQRDNNHAVLEKERKAARELAELQGLFEMMDNDGSGTLSWDEFKDSFQDPIIRGRWKLLDFGPEECKELFKLLDDGDGEIETGEFFEGLGRMKGAAQSKDVFRLQKCMYKVFDVFDELRADMEQVARGSHQWLMQPQSPTRKRRGDRSNLGSPRWTRTATGSPTNSHRSFKAFGRQQS